MTWCNGRSLELMNNEATTCFHGSRSAGLKIEGWCHMCLIKVLVVLAVCSALSRSLWGADVILNEYNAVGSADFLNGGDAAADEDGGRASDSHFGRVLGNGGDWFELVVIKDHLDMRGWQLDIFENGAPDETLDLTDDPIWLDLRSGTIITVAEDVPSDVSYDPARGDWWINVQANDDADGLYIEASSFPVSGSTWQLRIRNAAGAIVYGPAGEGVSPAAGIGGTEVFRLEDNPSASITPNSKDYDDGADFSTFGAANRWGGQDFRQLRTVEPEPASIVLLSPTGSEVLTSGDPVMVRWEGQGVDEGVLVEFSLDNGGTWSQAYPPNVGNSGQYRWVVPPVDSDQCLLRVSSVDRPFVYDTSDEPFTIFQCTVEADLTGDCMVNFFDFVIMASAWLECSNPYLPICPE